jgi:peptidoglycan hydrolase-like protein with peptidoglycan-binding domain
MSKISDKLSKSEHERILREHVLPGSELDTFSPQEHPKAIILAGQPGAGKGSLKDAVLSQFGYDIFPIDPDEQREYHPQAKAWQRESPYGWSQQTNADAGAFAGELREAGMHRRVNLLIDTTLGGADGAIKTIQGLQKAGYEVEIRAVAAHDLESRVGIDRRFTEGIDRKSVGRDVPLPFHDKVYADLPENLDKVAEKTGVRVRIYDRDDAALAVFDNQRDPGPPSAALREMRDVRLQSPITTEHMRTLAQDQADWHRDPQDRLAESGKLSPETLEALRRERLDAGKPTISARDSDAWSTVDELVRPGAPPARTPPPEPADPYPRLRGFNAGLAIEAGLTAYEWNETRQRAQVFKETLHNETAAVDAYVRQGAQTGGAVAGGVAGTGAAVLLNTGTAGTATLVAADAYLFGKAAEHGVELWQKHRIYHVNDDGVDWNFNGTQWIREDLRADLVADGQNVARQQDFAAPPDQARELSTKASAKAVEIELGQVPTPRDPFVQSAGDGGDPWRYQPDGGVWTREVVTAYDVNGIASAKETVEAKGEQAAQLSAQAQRIIDANLQAGPAEIATQYQRGHKAHGYDQTPAGDMPPAVATALNPDLLQASDGNHYRRDALGEWANDGQAANAQRALELELTRDRLLPALQDHQQQLANMPPWQPPTPEQQDQAFLREAYLNRGIDRDTKPEDFEASYLAVQRTRDATGVSAASTSLVLGQDASGQYTPDSPIHHVRFDADGTVQIAATTTREDIAKALADVRARSEDTPQQASPERTITLASPEERNAREQAQREANRQGLSQDDAQQAAHAAVVGASARVADAEAKDIPQAQSERGQDTPTAQDNPQAAAVAAMARNVRDDDSARLERERADAERNATERTAAKIEPTPTPERTSETPTSLAADRDPPQARMDLGATPAKHDSDTLRLGSRGDEVELLQYRLDRQGYRGPDGEPIPQTGQYGPDTEHAVRQFQTLHGMPATGVAEQDTREDVDRALAAQRERERAEPMPAREMPEPVIAPRTVGLTASGGRDGEDRNEREPQHVARAEAQPIAVAATMPDFALAHRAATRDERDDESRSRAQTDRTPTTTPETAQPAASLMTQRGHPAHTMYTQALNLIERGDVVPAGLLTQEEKSHLAAGVVAQSLSYDNSMTQIDTLFRNTNEPAHSGLPLSLIAFQGDVTTDYYHRASVNVQEAMQTPIEESSQTAQKAMHERQLTLEQRQAQEQALKERQETEGPIMRIGPRTLTQGPQDDGGSDGGGGGDGGG